MKSQHALECRITRARPSSTRLGERLATIHRASQEELFDLVGHPGRPAANSRWISRQLLVRLDAMDGVTLYGWMAKLSQIQCLYRTRNGNAVDQTVGWWIDEVLGRVATRVGGILAGPDTRLAKELLECFPTQYNLYRITPWTGVVRQLRAQDSPYLQAVVELLAPRAMDYMFDQRDFNDTASQLLDCLRGAADAALRARWAGWFLDSFAAFVERHRGRDWKMDWTLMGQNLQSFGQAFAVQLDRTCPSEDPYWLDVGQRLVRMYMSAQDQGFQQECLAQFMVQWLDAKGPWRALGLDDHHPLAMAMAQHPRVRREGLLDGLRQAANAAHYAVMPQHDCVRRM